MMILPRVTSEITPSSKYDRRPIFIIFSDSFDRLSHLPLLPIPTPMVRVFIKCMPTEQKQLAVPTNLSETGYLGSQKLTPFAEALNVAPGMR